MFFNTEKRYTINLPISSKTIVGKADDLEDEDLYIIENNPCEYHQDWPFELRETIIKLKGEDIKVHYFLIMNEQH